MFHDFQRTPLRRTAFASKSEALRAHLCSRRHEERRLRVKAKRYEHIFALAVT